MAKKMRSRGIASEMRSDLGVRVLGRLKEQHWAAPGQRIGVAVSGGADSVALLRLLLGLREKLGVVLSVVHFNHKLRGRASDGDEKFVAKLAARHDLAWFVEREDIAHKSKRERANLEDAARRARYAFFERLVSERRVDKIAVAHTADDQAETVLAHIFRGTGLAGLAGIHPEVGCVFRPLLAFRRAELRTYLRGQRQGWREDASNRDTKRTRARIRLKLVPLLEKQFQPAVVEHLCQLADLAREDNAWLESSAELRMFLNAKETQGEWRVALRDLLAGHGAAEPGENVDALWSRNAPQAISKRLIRLLVKRVKPHSGQLSSVHVDAVLRLAEQADSGKTLPLPGGVEVRRERESLIFRAAGKRESMPKAFRRTVELGVEITDVSLLEQSHYLRFRVIDWPREGRETNRIGAVLDRERICLPLVVRSWQPGDQMQPVGHQKRHKLARLLSEQGISRWAKGSWPVLVCGEEIVWARGLPVAAGFAAGDTTRKAVVITEVAPR
ncbi:MAG TPA: tRNA lysidine(34) synthetase TilS [Verrucomicrobiae bacterium]|nr:tRNA lysidine(34) synthetase TilS [Verrucomicrobiae bacterium]